MSLNYCFVVLLHCISITFVSHWIDATRKVGYLLMKEINYWSLKGRSIQILALTFCCPLCGGPSPKASMVFSHFLAVQKKDQTEWGPRNLGTDFYLWLWKDKSQKPSYAISSISERMNWHYRTFKFSNFFRELWGKRAKDKQSKSTIA